MTFDVLDRERLSSCRSTHVNCRLSIVFASMINTRVFFSNKKPRHIYFVILCVPFAYTCRM